MMTNHCLNWSRSATSMLYFYWYGQTLQSHRLLDTVIVLKFRESACSSALAMQLGKQKLQKTWARNLRHWRLRLYAAAFRSKGLNCPRLDKAQGLPHIWLQPFLVCVYRLCLDLLLSWYERAFSLMNIKETFPNNKTKIYTQDYSSNHRESTLTPHPTSEVSLKMQYTLMNVTVCSAATEINTVLSCGFILYPLKISSTSNLKHGTGRDNLGWIYNAQTAASIATPPGTKNSWFDGLVNYRRETPLLQYLGFWTFLVHLISVPTHPKKSVVQVCITIILMCCRSESSLSFPKGHPSCNQAQSRRQRDPPIRTPHCKQITLHCAPDHCTKRWNITVHLWLQYLKYAYVSSTNIPSWMPTMKAEKWEIKGGIWLLHLS